MAGQLVMVVGPSGVGKDTLMSEAARLRQDIILTKRVITRPSDAGGEDYEGVTQEVFDDRRARGEFALHWEAHGLSYGIPKPSEGEQGKTVLFNGSRSVMRTARSLYPELKIILITASQETLKARLMARGRESAEDIKERLARAAFAVPDDVPVITVHNDSTLKEAVEAFLAALEETSC